MAKATDFGLIQAPDGFYFGRIMKSGMLSKDSRKITEQEIIEMFMDLMRRNKAETGRSVMTIFSKRVPMLIAKLDPDIRECGVLPKPQQPQLTPQQIQMLKMRQMQMQKTQQQRTPLHVGAFSLKDN